jgi:ribulose-5-phosphate 4-epimerase/fuculose-1-phosphate aldolase
MEQEGVIKFTIVKPRFHNLFLAREVRKNIQQLNDWRQRLFQLDVIGCDLSRYGACYGNVSMRYVDPNLGYSFDKPKGQRSFLISGTQTGGLEELADEHFVRIVSYDVSRNKVVAEGPIAPSSETMTHSAIYDLPLELQIRYVFHAHSPQIWKNAQQLQIPVTDETVHYGTPQMAREVTRLFEESDLADKKILSMGGHEDGIISFGATAEEAGSLIEAYLNIAANF